LLAIVRLEWKWLAVANTLAYNTALKSFIVLALGLVPEENRYYIMIF
jgi:hypothetical protein